MTKKWNLKSKLVPVLRRLFFYSPLRRQAMKRAQIGKKYMCAECGKTKLSNKVAVDHKIPVVDPAIGFPKDLLGRDNWTKYIARLFCSLDELQVLCYSCHNRKTKYELRRRIKKTTSTR